MIQSLLFVLREGVGGLTKARFSSFAATATVTISLVLIGIFLVITFNINFLVRELKSRVELEVFLDDSFDEGKTSELEGKITQFAEVSAVRHISKEDAVLEFHELFDEKEENYFGTLGYNPLPASFRITLAEEFRNSEGAQAALQRLQSLDEIREEDVIYRSEYLLILERYSHIAIVIGILIGAILIVGALVLVSNNIRLIILSRRQLIQTMRLVGATGFFVRAPLFIQGVLQGMLGGLFSALFLYGLIYFVKREIPNFIRVNWETYFIILSLGMLLGFAGSLMSVRRNL